MHTTHTHNDFGSVDQGAEVKVAKDRRPLREQLAEAKEMIKRQRALISDQRDSLREADRAFSSSTESRRKDHNEIVTKLREQIAATQAEGYAAQKNAAYGLSIANDQIRALQDAISATVNAVKPVRTGA